VQKERCSSFDSGDGKKFSGGRLALAELAALVEKNGEPKQISSKQDYYQRSVRLRHSSSGLIDLQTIAENLISVFM
jgi:hypothetical protein